MVSFQVPQNFMPSWNGWNPLFWIAYDIYDGGPSIDGLVITKYGYGESIYNFLMDYYNGEHAHWKVPHLV
jgi:hypothetical protein